MTTHVRMPTFMYEDLPALGYRFTLCKSPEPWQDPTAELERIGDLSLATNRRYDLSMNKAGAASFQVPIADDLSRQIKNIRTCVLVERDGEIMWSGPVWTLNGSLPDGTLQVGCVGWAERLNYRELREDINYAGNNTATSQPWTDFEIVADVFRRVISYDTEHPPPVVLGDTHGTPARRTNSWTYGTKVSQILQDLSDVESGFDYLVDPATRRLDLYAWDTFTDRPNVRFGYNRSPNNVASLSFVEDASAVRNRLRVNGNQTFVLPPWEEESMDAFGVMEETVGITGVEDPYMLIAYGIAELVVKRFPMRFYEIKPMPYVPPTRFTTTSTPRINEDYYLRDVVRLSAEYGFVREDDRPIRVYGASITITDAGDELIDTLTTSYAPGVPTLPPPPEAIFSYTTTGPDTGGWYTVSFDGRLSTGFNLTYAWNLDVGAASSASRPTYTYDTGWYDVTLTVTDGYQRTDSVTISIAVGDPPPRENL